MPPTAPPPLRTEDHHLIFLGGLLAIIVAIAIVFFGPHSVANGAPVSYTVLDQGQESAVAEPVNYLITDPSHFAQLWQMIHGASSTPPAVDFSTNEVIAVFLGAGGAGIDSVRDFATERLVSIEAGECEGVAGPYAYQIAELPASALALAHQYIPGGSDCGVR